MVSSVSWMNVYSCSFRSEEHTSELQSQSNLVCRLLLEKKKNAASHVHHDPANPPIFPPRLPVYIGDTWSNGDDRVDRRLGHSLHQLICMARHRHIDASV